MAAPLQCADSLSFPYLQDPIYTYIDEYCFNDGFFLISSLCCSFFALQNYCSCHGLLQYEICMFVYFEWSRKGKLLWPVGTMSVMNDLLSKTFGAFTSCIDGLFCFQLWMIIHRGHRHMDLAFVLRTWDNPGSAIRLSLLDHVFLVAMLCWEQCPCNAVTKELIQTMLCW
jgi:hypothetical protein